MVHIMNAYRLLVGNLEAESPTMKTYRYMGGNNEIDEECRLLECDAMWLL
jgi:hypothetical protein